MEILFSILQRVLLSAILGAAIVVLDFKILVPTFAWFIPKENRPKPEDRHGVTARQSPKWQFWLAVILATASLRLYPASGVLDFAASALTLWVVFLGARNVVRWWDNQNKFFASVGQMVSEGDIPGAVRDGVDKLREAVKPAPRGLDRFRSLIGRMLVGGKKMVEEISAIAQQQAEQDPPKAETKEAPVESPAPAAPTKRELGDRARERLASFSAGERPSEEGGGTK